MKRVYILESREENSFQLQQQESRGLDWWRIRRSSFTERDGQAKLGSGKQTK